MDGNSDEEPLKRTERALTGVPCLIFRSTEKSCNVLSRDVSSEVFKCCHSASQQSGPKGVCSCLTGKLSNGGA